MADIQSNEIKRGGRREGAGRRQGSRNKKTAELLEAIEATGQTPLDYLLLVMRDETEDRAARVQAAVAAAPYCHSKLASLTVSGDEESPLRMITKVELVPLLK